MLSVRQVVDVGIAEALAVDYSKDSRQCSRQRIRSQTPH